MPSHSDLAKTVVAFANDAGGDIYIGIDNKHNIVGLPEITLLTIEDKHIIADLDFDGFIELFEEKTGEDLTVQTLRKLELIREEQGTDYPTNALVLFSDDDLRRSLFPNAKIECARFKGVSTEEFIDQKTIDCNIGLQAEDAYNFVLRHINKGATVEGVYTVSRWEYPVITLGIIFICLVAIKISVKILTKNLGLPSSTAIPCRGAWKPCRCA